MDLDGSRHGTRRRNRDTWQTCARGTNGAFYGSTWEYRLTIRFQYIIANLGFSQNFGWIDFDNLQLPATMSIDYIRVYQPQDAINIGCDPVDYPTMKYIETYVPVCISVLSLIRCLQSCLPPPDMRKHIPISIWHYGTLQTFRASGQRIASMAVANRNLYF